MISTGWQSGRINTAQNMTLVVRQEEHSVSQWISLMGQKRKVILIQVGLALEIAFMQ